MVSLERSRGRGNNSCKGYVDHRKLTRIYREDELTLRNNSEVFILQFFNVEEYSLYIVTVTAHYNIYAMKKRRNTSIEINTPATGKCWL